MFGFKNIIVDGSTYSQRGNDDVAHILLCSIEFILILHITKKIIGVIDNICQTMQQQS